MGERPLRVTGLWRVARAVEALRDAGCRAGVAKWLPYRLRRAVNMAMAEMAVRRQIMERVGERTILLADFPRCGIGWIRFTVATVLHYHRTGEFRKLAHRSHQDEMYRYAPSVTAPEDAFQPVLFNGGEHVVKTHAPFHPRFQRAIVLYRNPFDAIRSAYVHDLMDGVGNLYPRLGSRSPEENYLIWRANEYVRFHESWLLPIRSHPDRYVVIKYEEMLSDTEAVLREIFEFLGIDVTDLPSHGLSRLAMMYSRTDVSPPLLGKAVDRDEAVRRKCELMQQAHPLMTGAVLRRSHPRLARRVQEVVARMDAVRCTPDRAVMSVAEAALHG